MKFALHPDFESRDGIADIPYICSFSPMLRAAVKAMGSKEIIAAHIESVIRDIDSIQSIADSLKSYQPGNTGALRQVDIRPAPDDPRILLKCFVAWSHEKNMWVVWVEGGDENHWEKTMIQANPELN